MAKLITLDTSCSKTYKTPENAIKAFEALFGDCDVRYMILTNEEGRFYPVGLGENAMQNMVHFNFHVIG